MSKFSMSEIITFARRGNSSTLYTVIMKQHRNFSKTSSIYKDAIEALNSLQTNAQVLQKLKLNKSLGQGNNIEKTKKYLLRSGVSVEQLKRDLSVIHVSGTKGKGSVCALCESILHSHGYKTGFFSSPHLVAVRERIRINKIALPEKVFTKYFWKVFNALNSAKEDDGDMPSYFKFLTVMALNVFLAEKVDVAIIEVGIGGRFDCTNIFEQTDVVGISSLSLDHTTLLGNTIRDIAWQKGGILKPGSLAFTSPQPAEAMAILHKCAVDRQCSLWEAPQLNEYDWRGHPMSVGLKGPVQMINASLALQLSWAWINRDLIDKANTGYSGYAKAFMIDQPTAEGLVRCRWPGRYQILTKKSISGLCTYYIDGAHTLESLELCAQWFQQATSTTSLREHRWYSLIYNITGDRDPAELLTPLLSCHFDSVYFCPNILASDHNSPDLKNNMVTSKQQLDRCETNKCVWKELERKKKVAAQEVRTCPTVTEVLKHIEIRSGEQHVLVTGSLHLVGAVLSVLDPELTSSE